MGNYHISIKGSGQHHNKHHKDADQQAAALVKNLQDSGHSVTEATISTGNGDTDLTTVTPAPAPSGGNMASGQPGEAD